MVETTGPIKGAACDLTSNKRDVDVFIAPPG